MIDSQRLISMIGICLFCCGLTGTAAAATEIATGSTQYRHLLNAINILKDAGGDATRKPSPAWMANNIKTFLDGKKIKERTNSSAYGSNVDKGGAVFIDFNHLNSKHPGSWDPATETGYKKLLLLAQTLAHEKYHSENHGVYSRVMNQNESESEAYLHEIQFIDEFALAVAKKCRAIKSDKPGDKLKCYKEMRIIYQSKQDLIRVYNASQYATAGKKVEQVTVDVIDQVVEQFESIIPRWQQYAEVAGDNIDTIGQLQQEFDQQYGEAQVAFEAFVEDGEARALEGLDTSLRALVSDNHAKTQTTMLALADAVRSKLGLASSAAFSAIFGIDTEQGLLTADKTYLATAQFAEGSFNPLPFNQLVAEPDYKIYARLNALVQLSSSTDKTETATQLIRDRMITIEPFSLTEKMRRYQLMAFAMSILAVIVVFLWMRRKGR